MHTADEDMPLALLRRIKRRNSSASVNTTTRLPDCGNVSQASWNSASLAGKYSWVFHCKPHSADASPPLCTESLQNPEFAAGGSNFAHWMLAHAFPIVVRHLGSDPLRITRQRVAIAVGGNRAANLWKQRLAEILGHEDCQRVKRVHGASDFWGAQNCSVRATVSVPLHCMETVPFYRDARSFARFLRARFLPAARVPPNLASLCGSQAMRVVVMPTSSSKRQVNGINVTCDPDFAARTLREHRLALVCVRISSNTPLAVIARDFYGDAQHPTVGLLSGHGGGLVNLFFMPEGAIFFEFDHIYNIIFERAMYQLLAGSLGLAHHKVWLRRDGRREYPRRTWPLSPERLQAQQLLPSFGSKGYAYSVSLTSTVLDDVLRNVSSWVCRASVGA